MKKALLILTVIFSASFVAEAQNMPAKVSDYLKKNYPGWALGESWVIDSKPRRAFETGDFNGDGQKDYALLITKDDRKYALVLLASKQSFKAFNLLAQNRENAWIAGISTTLKGAEINLNDSSADSPRPFRIKNDGIYLYDGEGHGQTFYWQNGKFLLGYDL